MMDAWTELDDTWQRGMAEAVEHTDTVGPDLRSLLHAEQQHAWDCDDLERYLLCGRRGGKTYWAAAWLLEGARTSPRSLLVYLALTRDSARRIVWPVMRDVVLAAGLPPTCLHDQTLTVHLDNGSVIYCSGSDDRRTIESWRGPKLKRAVVDECGAQPDEWLGYLIDDILRPSLRDSKGHLACCGTPRPTMAASEWLRRTAPGSTYGAPVFRWDIRANPFFDDADAVLEDEAQRRGGWDSPSFRREWLGEWCDDPGALVFPLTIGRNTIDKLPERSNRGGALPAASWRYVIGVDVGIVDSTAISVVASHPLDDREFVVRVDKYEGMLPAGLRDKLRALKATYSNAPIVLDTGGMGKVHAEELTRQWSIYVEPAEKTQKRSHVRDIRERLLSGRVLVLDGPDNDALREEWAVLGWDEKRELPDGIDHASDATLYALRKLRHYTRDAVVAEPVLTEAEQNTRLAAEMKAKRSREMAKRDRSAWR
jgi:hypothetical protein